MKTVIHVGQWFGFRTVNLILHAVQLQESSA